MRADAINPTVIRQAKVMCALLGSMLAAQAISANAEAVQWGSSATPSPVISARDEQAELFSITVINMSGKPREAIVRNAMVNLPVATRVTLLMHAGEAFQVRSDSDSRIHETFVVARKDAGRIIAVP